MSTEEASPAAELTPAVEAPPTLRAPTFDEVAFAVAQPLPPSLPDLPPPPHPDTATVTTVTAVSVPLPPATTAPPTPSQPLLVSELLETGGASVARRVFSLIGLVLMAVFLGATIAGAVAGLGLLITLAAQHAGG